MLSFNGVNISMFKGNESEVLNCTIMELYMYNSLVSSMDAKYYTDTYLATWEITL